MTEAGIIAIVGIAATVLVGLGTTLLAGIHARRLDQARRVAAVQDMARGLIVNVLVEGRALAEEVWAMGTVIAEKADPTGVEKWLTSMLAATDSATKKIDAHDKDFARALTEARLLARDVSLRASLDALGALSNWWETVIEPQRKALASGVRDDAVLRQPLLAWHFALSSGLSELEATASRIVTADVAAAGRKSRAKVRPNARDPYFERAS